MRAHYRITFAGLCLLLAGAVLAAPAAGAAKPPQPRDVNFNGTDDWPNLAISLGTQDYTRADLAKQGAPSTEMAASVTGYVDSATGYVDSATNEAVVSEVALFSSSRAAHAAFSSGGNELKKSPGYAVQTLHLAHFGSGSLMLKETSKDKKKGGIVITFARGSYLVLVTDLGLTKPTYDTKEAIRVAGIVDQRIHGYGF